MIVEIPDKALRLTHAYPADWHEKRSVLLHAEYGDEWILEQSEDEQTTTIELRKEGFTVGVLEFETEPLAKMPVDEFITQLKIVSMWPYGSQLKTIRYVYEYLCKHNEWPNRAETHVKLIDDFDLEKDSQAWKLGWVKAHQLDYNHDDVRIPLRAVYFCEEPEKETRAFIRILKALLVKYMSKPNIPSPIEIDTLYDMSDVSHDVRTRMDMLLREEHTCIDLQPRTDTKPIKTIAARSNILDYRSVETMADYVNVFLGGITEHEEDAKSTSPEPVVPRQNSSVTKIDAVAVLDFILTDENLRKGCLPLARAGEHNIAVSVAATEFDKRLRKFAGQSPKGRQLQDIISQLFAPEKGLLRFDFVPEDDNAQQEGLMLLYKGAAMGIRNPTSHTETGYSPEEALEIMGMFDYLLSLESKVTVCSRLF